MDDKILIVGGYGTVGRMIAIELAELFPGRVIVAGRRYHKAEELAKSTGSKLIPMELDISDTKNTFTLPEDVRLVIMCLDSPDAAFAWNCLQRGVHYIDISADYSHLARIEALDSEARRNDATVVISVGLAPGLTNLLAAHCKSRLEQLERADIFVLLGLGEVHGEAAIRWTIDNLNRKYSIREQGENKLVSSLGEGKRVRFPNESNSRMAYRFNFSDQRVIAQTLDIPSVSTWLCFDSALTTNLFALLKKTGMLTLLRLETIRELMVKLFGYFHFGSDAFAVKVKASGKTGEKKISCECAVNGRGEARCTALIASHVAARLYNEQFQSGVHHIEQLFEPARIIAMLEDKGMTYHSF